MDINLIIIIISVVALIVNAVIKNKAKKETDDDTQKSFSESDSIAQPVEQDTEFIMDQQYYTNNETPNIINPASQEEIIEQNQKPTTHDNLTEKENINSIDKTKNINFVTDDINEIENIMAGFNLKSAIIYSEIINRKY